MFYAAGSPGTFAGPPTAGFGALAPAATRAPIRLAEIAAALKLVGAYPAIQNVLRNAQSQAAIGTEPSVAYAEQLYMQAHALARTAGITLAYPKDLTVASASASDATASAITKSVAAITDALKAGLAPAKPTGGALPPPSEGVAWFTGGAPGWSPESEGLDISSPMLPFMRPVGPLRVWQWLALGGVASVALGVAAKATRFAVIGGTVAALGLGVAGWMRPQRSRA